jgi:hypothetical protein
MPSSPPCGAMTGSSPNSVYLSTTFSPVPASTPVQVARHTVERNLNSDHLPEMDTPGTNSEPEIASDKEPEDEQENTAMQMKSKSFGNVELTGRGTEMTGTLPFKSRRTV